MKLQLHVIVLVGTASCLSACYAAAPTPSEILIGNGNAAAPTAERKLENIASPEQAVKSWWAYLDIKDQIEREGCLYTLAKLKSHAARNLPTLVHGHLLTLTAPTDLRCPAQVLQREIREVKAETTTRVLVFAVIKNATPLPSGATPDDDDLIRRGNGFPYKYVVEKGGAGWQIAEVYSLDDRSIYTDKWNKGYVNMWKKEYVDLWTKEYVDLKLQYIPSFTGQN